MGMGHLALKIEDQTLARDVFIHVGSRVQGKYFGLCLNFGVSIIISFQHFVGTENIFQLHSALQSVVTRCGGNKEV